MKKAIDIFRECTDEKTFSKIKSYETVTQMWENSVREYANQEAIVTSEKSFTFAELDDLVAFFRTTLKENGIKKGDYVGVFIPNSIDFVKVYLAINTLGAVAVLLPPQLDSMSVFGCSMKFKLNALVFSKALEQNLKILKKQNSSIKLILADQNSNIKTLSETTQKDDISTIIFTGGTTGKSKGSVLTNEAIMKGTRNGCYGIENVFNQKYLLILPLTHVFGLIRNLLTSIQTGSSMFICENNKDMFRDIAVYKPTIMVLVPALVEMALQLSKNFKKNMFGENLKTIICGAANVPEYLIQECNKIGIKLLPGYGLTESANLVSGNCVPLEKTNSVGVVYPEIETKVVDGELWLKGPNMQQNYFADEEENKLAYADGWFKTGDLVKFDEDGFLYIVGRKKEIIVLPSGENVSPAELESKFLAIEEIQDCLVSLGENGNLELEVLLRKNIIQEKDIKNPQEYVKNLIYEINNNLLPFQKVTAIKFREEDFIRSASMKIIRSQNGNNKK